jgi:hypothetical protein
LINGSPEPDAQWAGGLAKGVKFVKVYRCPNGPPRRSFPAGLVALN